MKLTNVLLNNLSVSTDLNADIKTEKVKANKKNGFENFMNDASKNNKVDISRRDENAKKGEVEAKPRVKKVSKEKNKVSDTDTRNPRKKVQSNEDKDVKTTEVDKIAAELNVEPERIMEILAQLNITIEDLVAKPEMLTDVLVAAFNVESPIELLNIPNVREVMANLKDIITGEQQADTEPIVEADIEENANVKNAESSETVVFVQKDLADKPLNDGLRQEAAKTETDAKSDEKKDVLNKTAVTQNEAKPAIAVTAVDQSGSSNAGPNQESTTNFIPVSVPVSNSNEARITFLRTEVLKNVNPQDVIKQMTETLKTDIRNGISEIKIILKPEQLGDITLKLLTENGIITAKFIAESERVKEIIESNFEDLRNSLKEQGINVSELSVSVGQEDNSDSMQHFLKEQQKSSARIRQIINGLNENDEVETEQVNDNLTDSSVDFTA